MMALLVSRNHLNMKTLPIFVSLINKPVLVVGGGDVALRKVQTLVKAQAQVFVVAHDICQDIREINADNLHLSVQSYEPELLVDKWLVIAATDDEALNDKVHLDALAQKIFVNVVDDPARCHFITPAIIDRSPLVFAISSGGEAPVLARLWKETLEKQIPQWTGRLAALAGSYRQKVKDKFTDFGQRRHFWERFFRGDLAALASKQQWPQITETIERSLAGNETTGNQTFTVCFGDGDPDNLTIKALQLMQLADVIVYPKDTPEAILDMCRKDADKLKAEQLEHQPSGIVVYLKASDYCSWH